MAKGSWRLAVAALCAASSALAPAAASDATDASPPAVTNVVLAGAYGNLAGKYLWKALFSLYLEVDRSDANHAIKIYAAGRDAREKGWPKVEAFLDTKLTCGPEHEKYDCTPADIGKFRSALGGIEYVQLKKDEHYESLCQSMSANGATERGRMFYLSVPPFAYAGLAKTISEKCTPPSKDSFLRVAFEKPFGSDLASAEVLAEQLATYLKEDQIYRVDHYLGKRGVQQILNYRLSTPAVNSLLTKKHVASIKVVMTEKEDCAGRTAFYDEYGVVRDVHQNHLTEVLALIGMDLMGAAAGDPAGALKAKADFLASIEKAELEHSVLGQYKGYVQHCREDKGDPSYNTRTPTFAGVSLRVRKGPLAGVPVMIVAGKMMEERAAYVEVQFSDLNPPPGDKLIEGDARSAIVFHIQGGSPKRGPEIRVGNRIVSHFVPETSQPALATHPGDGWVEVSKSHVSPLTAHVYVNGTEGKPDLPYDVLMSAMYHGAQDLFVGTEGLMESWKLWDTLLTEAGTTTLPPFVYEPGSTYHNIINLGAHTNHRIHEDL